MSSEEKKRHRKNCRDCIDPNDAYGRTLDNMSLSAQMNADIQHNLVNHLAIISHLIHDAEKEMDERKAEKIKERISLALHYVRGLEHYVKKEDES